MMNYPMFHAAGYDEPAQFKPERWLTLHGKDANYIPFGVMRNRP
jgi:cytochrome P450